MLNWLRREKPKPQTVEAWYGSILTVARAPEPYLQGWLEDTFEGRFQMVALVGAIVLRRLRDFDAPGKQLADAVYRKLFSGFDYALREEGVGDSSIARRIRKLGEDFLGLARAVDAALQSEDREKALRLVLERNVQPQPQKAEALARHIVGLDDKVQAMTAQAALSSENPWAE